MAKKVTGYIKLQVPAGAANPSPPIGPALGQRGLNIMEFCKAFNAKTQDQEKNMPIPVTLTVMPIERAEPSIISIAFSTSLALRSFILAWAISRTWARVTLPALAMPGALEPEDSFAAFFKKKDAGGVFISKVKLLSENTVMITGIGIPFSWSCVFALNDLQNSMMLRPRWPNAGPIGGDGLAAPAGTCNLI